MSEVSLSGAFLSSLLFKLKNAPGDRVSGSWLVRSVLDNVTCPGRATVGQSLQSQS